MKIRDWTPKDIHIPPSAKRDVFPLLVLYVLNCFVFSRWSELDQVVTKPWLLLVWLCGLAALVPLAWRDRAPATIFATQWAFTVAWVFTVAVWPNLSYYIPVVGILVALYAVAVHCSRKISLLALLASFIPNGLAATEAAMFQLDPQRRDVFIGTAVFLVMVTAGAWGAGRSTRASRRRVQHLERVRENLERERDTIREAEVLAAERRRIARELHDIVSHAVIGMVLQAAGAARVADTDLAQVKRSMVYIETTGKQAMAELRRLLGVLEAGDPANHAWGIDELVPQPGLANLTELLTPLRTVGMPVTVHVEGTPRDLDPSVDLAAYRIVQEGLTNVLKHAGKDANPQLRLAWEAHSLLIQIDNGPNLAEAHRGQALSGGRGLVGLRERAHAVGGSLHAGAHNKGGYRLTATLPLATPATAPGVSSAPRASSQGRGD